MTITINGTTGIAGVDGSAGTPAVQGADTNTGIYFGSDTISFAEGGAEAVQIDSSANLRFNSGYGSVATAYGCRAWVNFNGTGTVAIRASGNVTSITDIANGHYTVNLTTAMPDVNGAATMEASFGTPFGDQVDNKECYVSSSSTIQIGTYNASAYTDATYIYVALFR